MRETKNPLFSSWSWFNHWELCSIFACKEWCGSRAIVNAVADPVVVVGAVIVDIPMVDQVDIEQITSGDLVEVDGERGVVNIPRRKRYARYLTSE